jgi:hypothetical protein
MEGHGPSGITQGRGPCWCPRWSASSPSCTVAVVVLIAHVDESFAHESRTPFAPHSEANSLTSIFVPPAGVEPATWWVEATRSVQLSYEGVSAQARVAPNV